MKLPTWFKVIWWLLLCSGAAWLFYVRAPAIQAGRSAFVDVFIFLVLVALLLAPIFQEVSLFGLKFKQAIDDLQRQLSAQLSIFKAEIQSTITTSSSVNVTIPPPPTDEQLPELESRIKRAVSQALDEQGFDLPRPRAQVEPEVDGRTVYLFKMRHEIEARLRRIAESTEPPQAIRIRRTPIGIGALTGQLMKQELLHPKISNAIREIYSVCSPAIHGEPVTEAQVQFVRDVAPQVLQALAELERRTNKDRLCVATILSVWLDKPGISLI